MFTAACLQNSQGVNRITPRLTGPSSRKNREIHSEATMGPGTRYCTKPGINSRWYADNYPSRSTARTVTLKRAVSKGTDTLQRIQRPLSRCVVKRWKTGELATAPVDSRLSKFMISKGRAQHCARRRTCPLGFVAKTSFSSWLSRGPTRGPILIAIHPRCGTAAESVT